MTRRINVQVAQAWNVGFGKAMKDVYGIGIEDTLVYKVGSRTRYYVDVAGHDAYVAGLYKKLEDVEFLKHFHASAQAYLEHALDRCVKTLGRYDERSGSEQLATVYRDFVIPEISNFYVRMWTVFNIAAPLNDVVTDHLKAYTDTPDLWQQILSSPLVPNDAMQERIDLLGIKVAGVDRVALDRRLSIHTNNYEHIPMFDFDHAPYTREHFEMQYNEIDNAEQELSDIARHNADLKKKYYQLRAEIDDVYLNYLLDFLQENAVLRDYRDMLRQKLNIVLKRFYVLVGMHIGLTVEQVASLTNDEILLHLAGNTTFPLDEVLRREKSFLLVQHEDEIRIVSGEEADRIAQSELFGDKTSEGQVVTGISGSQGTVTGRVALVFSNQELNTVQDGDVLITSMTRQDFVPVLRNVSAIVTDEGSITCHAAIIARELQIPCIVATEIATEVFQNGDIVEVDATNGIVRKLSTNV